MSGSRFLMLKYNSDRFNFTYFNTPLDSINSIKDFDLYDSYPADPNEIKVDKEAIIFNSASVEFATINPISSFKFFKTVYEDTSNLNSIIFNLGMWEYQTKSTNFIDSRDTNWKFSTSSNPSYEISFSISKFKDGDPHSIQVQQISSDFKLTNIPTTIAKNSYAEYNIINICMNKKSVLVIKISFLKAERF